MKEKVYYPIIVLTTFALLSRIKGQMIERPEILISRKISLGTFHEKNKLLT